jgi:hypothetical protein
VSVACDTPRPPKTPMRSIAVPWARREAAGRSSRPYGPDYFFIAPSDVAFLFAESPDIESLDMSSRDTASCFIASR